MQHCARDGAYVHVYTKRTSVVEKWGQVVFLFFFFNKILFAFDLNPRSWQAGCHSCSLRCCLCTCRASNCQHLGNCPVKSWRNNRLMGEKGAKASTLVPKRVQKEVKKNRDVNCLKHHISLKLSLTRQEWSRSAVTRVADWQKHPKNKPERKREYKIIFSAWIKFLTL